MVKNEENICLGGWQLSFSYLQVLSKGKAKKQYGKYRLKIIFFFTHSILSKKKLTKMTRISAIYNDQILIHSNMISRTYLKNDYFSNVLKMVINFG